MTMEQRLAAQRHAFLRDGAPTIAQRKAALRRLRSAILAQRSALTAAVSADFGHRSPYETDILEILVTVQAIDYLLRHLKRFMQPERRHVALPYQAGRAYVQYQPKGVIGVMAPWNYPFVDLHPAGHRPGRRQPRDAETFGAHAAHQPTHRNDVGGAVSRR